MTKKEAYQKGARSAALSHRRRRLEEYYENPSICQTCGCIILVRPNQSPSHAKKKKFCTSSCSAKCNNIGRDRWATTKKGLRIPPKGQCESCGREIDYTPRLDRIEGYQKRKYCDLCRRRVMSNKLRQRQRKVGNGFSKPIEQMTKGEFKKECRGKHTQTFRNAMSQMARKNYQLSENPNYCAVCGYEKHYEVCHLKGITEFSDDMLVSEINRIDNLVALCPTHHWELDKGLLNKEGLKKRL